ncbi:ribonuclease D [Microbulbifer sp. OS29]|uniref:Ribonuclease D n=1 Tax=Microbulbifer okhotskensis TaxID=2926617 RepID=A0A9X2EQ99_9GAMM|nr:ribonuclease D [Microbulbifer okhotskensis]MCO1333621.1 ribonuclease D [Microbulbifer okhotskensis]
MTEIDTTPRWIDSFEQLASLCAGWREQRAVALDTEFMRSRTFYPQPALVQIGDGKHCYLIDNLAIADLQPLRDLLLDTAVTKVMHSCSEDLETLERLLGVIPEPIFDTQIAAALCGMGAGLGYAATVNQLLRIDLPKSETRSDWLQRPLSEAQKNYAALDVAWLPVLYGVLLKDLSERGRLEWLHEDCASLVTVAQNPSPAEVYYQKVKGAWRLRNKQLAVLQDVCAWREREARVLDMPRNHLLKEAICISLAQQLPRHKGALSQLGIEGRALREHGDTLLKIVSHACERVDPPPRMRQPLNRQQGEVLKQLRLELGDIAERTGLPSGILIRKKELEALVQADRPELEGRLGGWRADVIGQPLLEALRQLRKEELK